MSGSSNSEIDKKLFLVIIAIMVLLKLVIHFFTITTYGLHRDAYLYLAQSQHLAWGFISVPPFTATILALQRLILPDTVFFLRLLPVITGAVNLILIGLMVKELGGRKIALVIAMAAYLVSPAFLRSNGLIQPVSFNQMFWLLSAYIIVLIVKREQAKYWIWLGVIAGIGFLNKYSVVLFFTGFLVALLLTPERKWLKTRFPYIALLIGILIALPNLIWQYNHNWPVVHHMNELRETQLVHVEISGFLLMQLLMNFNLVFIWLAGLLWFLFLKKGKQFRILGYIYLIVLLILIIARGKHYYSLGLYPMLFAGGGMLVEQISVRRWRFIPFVLAPVMLLMIIPALPFSLPIYDYPSMVKYGQWAADHGFKEALRWEDGNYYELPQDYADMSGWEEMAKNVGALYNSLPEEDQQTLILYTDSYGQAGAILFYKEKYHLPDPVCFNGSFVFWIPKQTYVDRAIYVCENPRDSSDFFNNVELKAQNMDPYARDRGYVYYLTEPNGNAADNWNALKKEVLIEYTR